MGSVMNIISGVALKLMPDKTGVFKPDPTMATRNKTISDFIIKDPLLNHEKVFAGNIKAMIKLE